MRRVSASAEIGYSLARIALAVSAVINGLAGQGTPQGSTGSSAPAQQGEVASLAREAQDAFNREDWEAAIIGYEKLVKAAPGRAEFHFKLGAARYSSSQPYEAIPALKEALRLNPALTGAADFLAASLAETGQCKEALPHLKKAASRVTDKTLKRTVEVDGIRCATSLNQLDAALDFMKLLNRDFPRDPEALYVSVHVLSDLSIRASQELLSSAPSSYQVHLLNAEALETQGKWEEAAMEYRTVLTQNPRVPGIHYRMGRLLLSQPKQPPPVDEARREFEEELRINPANAGAEFVLGELARQAEQWPEAIAHFSRATKLDTSFADAFIGLGRSLLAADRLAEATPPLEIAVKLQPDNPATHFHLATAYRRAGRKADADREFIAHQQASEKARQNAEAIQTGVQGKSRPPQ